MKIILLMIIGLLFFSTIVFALTDITPSGTVPAGSSVSPETQATLLQLNQKISALDSKIDNVPTNEELTKILNQQLALLGNALEQQRSEYITLLIASNFCTIILAFSILFFFKSKKLV